MSNNRLPSDTTIATGDCIEFFRKGRLHDIDGGDLIAQLGSSGTPADGDTQTFSTVAALVASSLANDNTAIVRGLASAGDGGAGLYMWDSAVPASTYDVDSANVIFANTIGKTTNGCWKRVLGSVPQNLTIPIGAGEKYTTVNAAIDDVGLLTNSGSTTITLELESGFTMSEQVIVANGTDLSNVKITSVDAQVTVDRSALTQHSGSLDGFQSIGSQYGVFMAGNNATLPRIGTIFAFDSTGSADFNKHGIFITNGSKCIVEPDCGMHDTDGSGALVQYSSTLIAPESTWDNNGTDKAGAGGVDLAGIRSIFQGIVSAQEATVTNSNDHGIQIIGASVASVRNATITSATDVGLYGGGSSVIHARGVDITLCSTGIYAYEGCSIRLIQSNSSNNTGNGLWIDSNSVVNSATGTTINNNGGNGVRITSGGKFAVATPTITGNTLDGINVADGDATISAGTISGNGSNDLEIGGGDSTIRLSGVVTTTSGNSADNNVTDSNVSAFNCPTVNGSGGIYGRGGDSGNRGTATIASGSTSIAVTHNVDFTPVIQEVSVTPTNDMNSATKFWVSNMTSTQFTINTDQDPGAGGATFGWNLQRQHG